MNLKIFINGVYSEEEKALINMDTKEVILSGDYYHNKIDETINGFLKGLNYVNIKYNLLKTETITPENKMFNICNFYEEED